MIIIMSSTDRCDRSHKSCPLSGAQKLKEQKTALECSFRGTSKLSSYFSLLPVIPQNVTKEVEDHGDKTLEENDSTLTVPIVPIVPIRLTLHLHRKYNQSQVITAKTEENLDMIIKLKRVWITSLPI